jgi:hypothetical protein
MSKNQNVKSVYKHLEKYETNNLDLGNTIKRMSYVSHGLKLLRGSQTGLNAMAVDSMIDSLNDAETFIIREIARQKEEDKKKLEGKEK